jgi:hypothetical protein
MLIAGGIVLAVPTYAWINRFDYKVVEVGSGNVFETRHDRWTGKTCVSYANAWQLVPQGLFSCEEIDLSEFVPKSN